ncbi:S41 family peptidase [Lentilitoribacter sp. Alg239-R112]|uniref:S41 family peptidase n=1 Tax=Lentilitoribacter sp. Alg239-R112 TaxID=2305987 RepID=UPI0013A6A16B|nr:S41 family peptidase [Lentilitoribacter sp. Alg239-R112]
MIRKISLLAVGIFMGAAATSFIKTEGLSAEAASSDTYRQISIFGSVFERIRAEYVTPPDEKKLVQSAISGMLSSLDPHSSYLDQEAANDMRTQTRGEFGGLGIEVTMEDDVVKVITPIDDTPASKAGVLAGDLIVEIDGEAVRGLSLGDAVDRMRGPVNTPILLTVIRQGADKPLEIEVVRDIIAIRAVRSRAENDVGYLRVISFTEKTFSDLDKAISKLTEEIGEDKLKGFVLDLRLNPGGLLDQAISVSDAFLDRGEIVSTRGRDPETERRFNARPGDLSGGKPLIVMINGGSASASEIVAGALQDHKRATILGTRSFGKGSVQTIIPMNEFGSLRLTTALYYTPSGASIQGKGILPDIKVDQPIPEELQGRVRETGESELRGHIEGNQEDEEGSGSIAYVPPDPEDDEQLNYALQLLRGEIDNDAFPPMKDQASNN